MFGIKEKNRAKRVLKEVLENKKDNLVKLRLDLSYELKVLPESEAKHKELSDELTQISGRLIMLRKAGGQSDKSRIEIQRLEEQAREKKYEIDRVEKAIEQAPYNLQLLKMGEEFFDLIRYFVENPEQLYSRVEKYREKIDLEKKKADKKNNNKK